MSRPATLAHAISRSMAAAAASSIKARRVTTSSRASLSVMAVASRDGCQSGGRARERIAVERFLLIAEADR